MCFPVAKYLLSIGTAVQSIVFYKNSLTHQILLIHKHLIDKLTKFTQGLISARLYG